MAANSSPPPAAAVAPPKAYVDLCRAIEIQQNHSTDPSVVAARQRAFAFTESVKAAAEGWKLLLQGMQIAGSTQTAEEIRFWLIDGLSKIVQSRYASFPESDRVTMRGQLMVFIRDVAARSPQSHACKSKLAVLIVQILKFDYPEKWTTFFADFMGIMKGLDVADIFFRVLRTIDEDIFVADEKRSAAEIKHNTLIKDSMRSGETIKKILEMMYQYVSQSPRRTDLRSQLAAFNRVMKATESKPQTQSLTISGLKTVREYVAWIEITLVANDKWIPLLYSYLQVPAFTEFSAGVISEILFKKMPADKKWALLGQLRLGQTLTALLNATTAASTTAAAAAGTTAAAPAAAAGIASIKEPAADKLSMLIHTFGDQLLWCVSEVKSGITGRAPSEAEAKALTEMAAMLETVLQLAHKFLDYPRPAVAGHCVDLFLKYVHSAFKANVQVQPKDAENYRTIFVGFSSRIAFPPKFNFEKNDDSEISFKTYRESLIKVLNHQIRILPDVAIGLANVRLQQTLANVKTIAPNQIEATLKLVDLIGENMTKLLPERLKTDPLRSMVDAVLKSDLASHSNPSVVLSYFVLISRYCEYFELVPTAMPAALQSLMDKRGLGHTLPIVRSCACRMLAKAIKAFSPATRAHIKPFLEVAVKGLTQMIHPSFDLSLDAAAKRQSLFSADDSISLCEVIGTLVSSQVSGSADQSRNYFAVVWDVFHKQLKVGLSQKQAWLQRDADMAGKHFGHLLDGMCTLTKSLKADGAVISSVFLSALPSLLEALAMNPRHAAVQKGGIFFVHRMIDICPADAALANLPALLKPLLVVSDAVSIGNLVAAINSVMIRYLSLCAPLIEEIFVPLVTRLFELIKTYAYVDDAKAPPSGYSAQRQERLELQKTYYVLLHKIVGSGLHSVLTGSKNAASFKSVMESVVRGCVDPPDATVNKNCLSILHHLIKAWHAATLIPATAATGTAAAAAAPQHAPMEASRLSFIFKDVTTRGFQCAFSAHINPNDATASLALSEFIEIQRTCAQLFGAPYLKALGELLISALGASPALATGYIESLQKGEQKQFRDNFRAFIASKKGIKIIPSPVKQHPAKPGTAILPGQTVPNGTAANGTGSM